MLSRTPDTISCTIMCIELLGKKVAGIVQYFARDAASLTSSRLSVAIQRNEKPEM
jgi:hypothetical protein